MLSQYGCYTFNDDIMKERLTKEEYTTFHESIIAGKSLTPQVATIIAKAMKEWAIEKGATHFTHWFSPLTGTTAGKHDAFLELDGDKPILKFGGKMLRKGESDASSFPTGGLRATFEARGYTSWDCTSPAFVKDDSLYIPTLFCSYTGEALDNKTPLLKSCDALSNAVATLLPLLGEKDVKSAVSYVGSEQEYFLIPEEYYEKRLDLKFTGRTLFGANPPKGQELDDHYYGSLKYVVAEYMKDLENELWKYGIPAKTKHNEAAPGQYEIACIYRPVNTTTDNNNLLMELMQDIAKKHKLTCLLHEKPFAGINGSGKHNNWSVVTNTNINLFSLGNDPINNIPFLAALACIIKGVDEYADLLRYSIASPGNDHRLGGNEAPPAIISIYLGEELDRIIDAIINNENCVDLKKGRFQTGISVLTDFSKDNNDRNRTSPFAFTGNKFEFRGVGSSQSIGLVNTILNGILSFEMLEMAKLIKQGNKPIDIIKKFLTEHKRIIFNGDGYSSLWEKEAEKRGLYNIKNTVDAIQCLKNIKNINLLTKLGIFSNIEIDSRYEISLENYCKKMIVESATAIKMVNNQIYPSAIKYLNKVANASISLKENNIDNSFIVDDLNILTENIRMIKSITKQLEKNLLFVKQINDFNTKANYIKDIIIPCLDDLRKLVDELEIKVDNNDWPVPTYVDLLFTI